VESGYDVYMGQYRGVYPRKLAQWKEKRDGYSSYWDYSIDHIAKYDIQAFLKRILAIKVGEFIEMNPEEAKKMSIGEIKKLVRNRLQITYIGHSLGGMILPMYIVLAKQENRDHLLTKAILLSPAGTHFNANWVIWLIGVFTHYIMPIFTTNFHLPGFLI
jgi:pimeloyl-ACP methyl ester carboxylesterase